MRAAHEAIEHALHTNRLQAPIRGAIGMLSVKQESMYYAENTYEHQFEVLWGCYLRCSFVDIKMNIPELNLSLGTVLIRALALVLRLFGLVLFVLCLGRSLGLTCFLLFSLLMK